MAGVSQQKRGVELYLGVVSAQVYLKSWRRIWFQTCHMRHEEPYAPPTLRGWAKSQKVGLKSGFFVAMTRESRRYYGLGA